MHQFTHFILTLDIFVADVEPIAKAPQGCRWVNEYRGRGFAERYAQGCRRSEEQRMVRAGNYLSAEIYS